MINNKVENIPWLKEVEELRERFKNLKPLNYSEKENELKGYKVDLDSDPTSVGVGNLNAKIAEVDGYMGRTATILMNAIANEGVFNSLFNDVQQLYNKYLRIQLQQEDVAKLSNQNLRQAAAEDKIEDIGKLKYVVEKALSNAKTHTKICREKLDSLDTTNKNISRQITVIQTQIEIGEIQRKANKNFSDF